MVVEETSIIKTIQGMVSEGESEEKILKTLKELGVEPGKAKRLLLVSQAETLSLLRKEVEQLVKGELARAMPQYIRALAVEAKEAGRLNKQVILEDIQKRFEKISNLQAFREEIESSVKSSLEANKSYGVRVNIIEKTLSGIGTDIESLKVKTLGMKHRTFAIVLLAVGMGFSLAALYLVFAYSLYDIPIERIPLITAVAAIGIVIMFLSTRV